MANNTRCEFCSPDADGFFTHLPRNGTGNAVIHADPFEGPVISVRGPNRTCLDIPINHCPICGRVLREEQHEA